MTYVLPAARTIDWSAGSDQWNDGSLPTYTTYDTSWQSSLVEGDGTTNNASAIQAALNAASSGQAVTLPAGIFYVNTVLTIPSNKALRGAARPAGTWLPTADATVTTLKFGSSGGIRFGGTTRPTFGAEVIISSGYTKGSQTLVLATASHGLVVGDWISIFEDSDADIVIDSDGTYRSPLTGCTWCGDDTGSNLIQQFAQVTSVSGATIGISRPMYHTYVAAQNPGIKKVTWNVQYAGIEHLRLNGYADIAKPFVQMTGALFCWVKGIETYNASATAQAGHIKTWWSHGCEYRDSYCHTGRNHSSDRNYGIFFYHWNSDHKIENNILRCHRHSLCFEGGGSGCAILYNYADDNWESEDATYLAGMLPTHGPHPMMNLYEGNIFSHLECDDVFGSSSHMVLFRNHFRGEETDGADRTGAASWGFYALDIRGPNHYYSAVGNVLGVAAWSGRSTILRTGSASQCAAVDSADRVAYYVGCQDGEDYGTGYDADCSTTFLAHGNYDYVANTVSYWDGGSDHTLADSLYYDSKPTFLGSLTWPPIGPDVDTYTTQNAALYLWTTGEVPTTDTPPSGTIVLSVR